MNRFPMNKPSHRMSPIRLLALLWIVYAFTGCTVHRLEMGPTIDFQAITIQEGTMGVAQVLDQLGPPGKISALPNGFVFLYEYFAPRERMVGGRIPIEELEEYNPFKMDVGRGQARRQTLLLIFDHAGMLLQQHHREDQEALGRGVRLSFIASYGDLIDTGYLDQAGPNQWGLSLLEPLKKGLNRQQDLESGRSGVEQIGTPSKVGQRALEFN